MGNSLDSEPDSSAGFHYSHWDHLFPISIAIVCTFFLTIIFLTVFFAWMKSQLQYRMEVENIRDERHSYDAGMIWKRRGQEDWELVHGYIVRDGLNVNYSAGIDKPQASGSRGSFPSKGLVDIKLSSEHLSVNGVRLIPTSASRIFVLTEPGIQVPMTLSSQELAMFHPEVYPLSLEKSDLWRTKFKSLVDPGVIERDAENSAMKDEEAWNLVREKLRIKRVPVYCHSRGNLYYHAEFDGYPNGTFQLANAFFTYSAVVWFTRHDSDIDRSSDKEELQMLALDGKRVCLRPHPSFYMINRVKMGRNKVFVQRQDGVIEPLELTDQEYGQFSKEIFENEETLTSTVIYREKVAPAIGAPEVTPSVP